MGGFMAMKGFLEWRILAAIFAILIVLSSALTLNTGLKDFILGLGGNLGDLFRGSPLLPGDVAAKSAIPVEIRISGDNISLSLDQPVNITYGGSTIEGFKGVAFFDLARRSAALAPAGTGMRISVGPGGMLIENARIQQIRFSGVDFSARSEKTNVTEPNGDIEIDGFSGDIRASDSLVFSGNVTRVRDGNWAIG